MKAGVFPEYTDASALLSPDEVYRYTLTRTWADGLLLNWVMLNPSKADGAIDDPTIRKVVGFTQRLGYAGFIATNLFAFRATDPKDLIAAERAGFDIVGPENDHHLVEASMCDAVVCAWGAAPARWYAEARVAQALRAIQKHHRKPLWCLERTKHGAPRHPLMAPYRLVTEGRLAVYAEAT